jgi:uncharacterized protein (DUF3820 family)
MSFHGLSCHFITWRPSIDRKLHIRLPRTCSEALWGMPWESSPVLCLAMLYTTSLQDSKINLKFVIHLNRNAVCKGLVDMNTTQCNNYLLWFMTADYPFGIFCDLWRLITPLVSSVIYDGWLPLWYLLWFMRADYPFAIFCDLWLVVTPLLSSVI